MKLLQTLLESELVPGDIWYVEKPLYAITLNKAGKEVTKVIDKPGDGNEWLNDGEVQITRVENGMVYFKVLLMGHTNLSAENWTDEEHFRSRCISKNERSKRFMGDLRDDE
jgi:hypothetical protein